MGRPRKNNLHLPERVYLRRGRYYYANKTGQWIPLGETESDALISLQTITGRLAEIPVPTEFLTAIFTKAKANAVARSISFELTYPDLMELWFRCGGRCEVTGGKFHLGTVHNWHRRPLAPSIDRINNESGYTPTNCRLVYVAVNIAFGEWGEEIFSKLARGYIAKKAGIILDVPIFLPCDRSENIEKTSVKSHKTTDC